MADAQQFVVSVKGLTKAYGATSVLKGVDFSVARGEVHALLGGNGAGKSTLIRVITGSASKMTAKSSSGILPVQFAAKRRGGERWRS
ncbi:ATP-binding cassette domain-containing protein [Sinorhizobium fredii]|uniref:ATP-binding cassette domain-containing protein n=1 Tax=Rhizobium fredii TaxID=380 RepID=A0A844A301_RHIFR|nr:ATP-binding cassette domain-containing protein [Sinorhizobium fredii]ASY71596.1 Ribose ABC transport system, ATP-binding protein RbsA [Sinorhizobium fredii CCBAU 83666]MQX07484.1 ATP-binding cassette domain-containing protein [Sinorhizobium fredii]GEC33714.1 hypothetical protein EFR01_38850 [Sinorhizobium fredii]GLS06753.1 hypothetical protein GCM10007864_03780 [Sinorhizobium fredii]